MNSPAAEPQGNTDPSPQPSPLRQGRGGIAGRPLAIRGSGAGRSPRWQCQDAPVGKTSVDSRLRSRRRQSALSALFEKSAPTDVGGYDCSDAWIRPEAGAACLAGNERRER